MKQKSLKEKQKRFSIVHLFFILFFAASLVFPKEAQVIEYDYSKIIKALELRNIGPANMGGRTVDIAVPENNTSIIYAAVGPSGLWKSINNGLNWSPVFDKKSSVSVGAVAVSQSHPDIVWVGTGEATCRNSAAIGDGVYKSVDSGKTWENMGLENTRHIAKIIIDPVNPDIVYVGALGHLWGPNQERGVFKTKDGGKTWEKVLYLDENTGTADMAIDPSNNRILYAAAYNFRRMPYSFRSGGKHSGIYKTTDRGETWKRLTKGLPGGVNGRIGLAVSRSRPELVYAIVENKNSGIFRSEDRGETWIRMCDKKTFDIVNVRPFYFSNITVDPNNDLIVYAYSIFAFVSKDGGKTFKNLAPGPHGDHHIIWIDPKNSHHIISGNDGGIDISWDGGKTWHAVQNATWAEVYQLGFDLRDPYYVYAGLQDNGIWGGPVNSRDKQGILNLHWYPVSGGDGFYVQVDPKKPHIIYGNAQMGRITRFNLETGDFQAIIPRAPLDEEPYRFNWNSPIHLSPHDSNIIYFGGNFLFKSTHQGNSWTKISPDLSSNDPKKMIESGGPITTDNSGAEVHCTILTISESPVKQGVIWAGTDDGNLWITRDNGKTWTNVIKNINKVPDAAWISRVEASHFSGGTAYVTIDRHRVDDYSPYVYKTEDSGKTWKSLRANLPGTGYLHVIREDPLNKNLLYLGSEFGLYFSFNGGKKWVPLKNGFPTAAVRDIQVHPQANDLVIGTHGRGVWIIDDISPLQQLKREIFETPAVLFNIRPAALYLLKSSSDPYSIPTFSAPNPPFGAAINYYLNIEPEKGEKVFLHIYDTRGSKVRTLEGTGSIGLNRVYWDLRGEPAFKKIPEYFKEGIFRYLGLPQGPLVLPGKYRIVLDYKEKKYEKEVIVKADKSQDYPVGARLENQEMINRLNDLLRKIFMAPAGIKMLDKQLQILDENLKSMEKPPIEVIEKLKALREKIEKVKKFFAVTGIEGIFRRPLKLALSGGPLVEQLYILQLEINSYPGSPTQTQKKRFKEISEKLLSLLQQVQELKDKNIPGLNRLLRENQIDYIRIPQKTF
ncbi:MAG: hypothetical protein JSV88_06615 [Candidatus Aminicenantes bacterium]|nr:MAG: hypothetical protein JSV88_06615 [Candidatus Aminicenantes bacterium]